MMAKMHHDHHGEHSRENMQKKCDEGFKIINCHKQCGEDLKCHDSCPLPECPKMAAKVKEVIQCNAKCGSDFACRTSCNLPVKRFVEMCSNLKKPHLEDVRPPPAQFIVSNFQACQTQCAGNVECMEGCPKPFWLKFKRTCQEAIPIMECHQSCGRDHACHVKCPLPSCPHMKAQVQETLKCHAQCEDQECHHMCPKPMKETLLKCKAFEEAQQCHGKCEDFKCHHECPKARLWQFFGQQDHHDGFHHHEHEHGERDHQDDIHNLQHHDGFHHHHDGFHHHHDGFHHHHDGFHHHHDGFDHHEGDFHHHEGDFHHRHGDFHHHEGDFHHQHGDFHHHEGDFHHHEDDFHHDGPQLRGFQPKDKVVTCATKCQENKACRSKCAAAWFELKKDCSEMVRIMGCHQGCHSDSKCHSSCPLPQQPWLKEQVEASMACHHECGSDHDCHHRCPCPFAKMQEKCATLGPEVGSWTVLAPKAVVEM
eukprot:Skav202050  [mRNA]  locus=scaffold1138:406507:407943:- [translate_table: standard]